MARIAGKRTISLDEVSQTIDVTRYIDAPTNDEKEQFATLAIERMINRTLDGEDRNNSSFKPYTEKYAAKKGVSVNSVDMFLEGDMLQSITPDIINDRSVKIYVDGDLETKKSFNHVTGDTLPKRDFFGISEDEANSIANQVKRSRKNTKEEQQTNRQRLSDLRNELAKLGVSFED
jgi:hypothetical protein